jgi:hypothetical protein
MTQRLWAEEGGEEDGKYNPSSPRFTHNRVENNALQPQLVFLAFFFVLFGFVVFA